MAWTDRLGLGIIFILINIVYLIITTYQLIRSTPQCSSFSSYKMRLTARILNFCTTALLVIFAFIDTDFWIWDENLSTISDEIFYINICLKGLIDISICITGSMIILELIRAYFEQEIAGQDVPSVINIFWFVVATTFSFMVFVLLLIAFAASLWVFVRIYGDVRLLYLSIAALGMAYTYYWVFYSATEEKTHLRNAVLLLLFAIAAFIGTILSFIYTFITDKWTFYDVVSAGLNDANSPAQYAGRFIIFAIGWAGYWFIISWYIKFVWVSNNTLETRTHDTIEASSPTSANAQL
eukprot:192030_1